MSSTASARWVAAIRRARGEKNSGLDACRCDRGLRARPRSVSRTVSSGNSGGRLEGASEAAPGSQRGAEVAHVGAQQLDAARRGHEPADGVHQRGLAGAVGADQPDDLVATDLDRDVVVGAHAAEGDRDRRVVRSGTSGGVGAHARHGGSDDGATVAASVMGGSPDSSLR